MRWQMTPKGVPGELILLPSEVKAQRQVLLRLSGGHLTFRPTRENTDIIEYARRNRMLLDLRSDPPALTLHAKCRWKAEDSKDHP